jgi:hypothetical protein
MQKRHELIHILTYMLARLDLYLLPLPVLGLFVLQLDRGSILNTLTDTNTEDLGITSDDINLENQLMLAY